MPQIPIGSSNIIDFGFSLGINIYARTMLFQTSPLTTYNTGGINNVQGISFKVEDANGVLYTDYDFTTPDIIPSVNTAWTFDWSSFGLPFILGNTLIITGAIKDQNGTIYYTDPVYKTVCKPVGLNESGYVPGIFQIIPDCINNVLTVKELTVLIYNKTLPTSVSKSGNLFYPTGTGVTVAFANTPFSNNLIVTGQNRIECTTVATYSLGDDINVLVSYITKQQFDVNCSNFLGDILCCISKNQQTYLSNCDNAIGAYAQQKSYEILPSLMLGVLKQISGQDPSAESAFIKRTLNCDCGVSSLGQNEMTPVNPAVSSIVLIGAGGTSVADPVITGDTKTFTILSKNYLVSKSDSLDLAYSIVTDTSVTNQVNFKLKFNYSVQSGYILTAIGADPTLLAQLNSLISLSNFNIDLSSLNGKCVIDISNVNYFLSYKVPNGSSTIKNVIINGVTHNAPASLAVSNSAGIVAWLNGLALGVFQSSFSNASGGSYVNILTNSNSNTVTSATFTVDGNDNVVVFQKTSTSMIAVLQAIIDYICALTALQVSLGNSLSLNYFDYNGEVQSYNFGPTDSQNSFNVGIQNVINNIVQRIDTLTGITCAKIQAVFPDRPASSFLGAGRVYGKDQDGNCISFTQQQVALSVMQAASIYQDVKDAFCAVDCNSPVTCPDISNINMAMVGNTTIGIYGVSFGSSPTASQSVTVRYKLSSSSTYITATNNLLILPNGNISGTTPYTIPGLSASQVYDVQVINNCGGTGFIKQITTPSGGVYSGSYLLDSIIYTICAQTPVTLYSSQPFGAGITLYTDAGLSSPATGHNYVAGSDGAIYTINSSTGVVGSATGNSCSGGTPGTYSLGGAIPDICSNLPTTLYTSGAFAVGKILYTDSALTSPVTGFIYVLNLSDNKIYNLNTSTGLVGADTTSTCTGSAILTFSFLNVSGFQSFVASLSRAVDANIVINRMFADGFTATDCNVSSANASAQKNSSNTINSGGTSVSTTPDITTGSWNSSVRYKIYNVLVNGNPANDGDVITVGTFSVVISIPSCASF